MNNGTIMMNDIDRMQLPTYDSVNESIQTLRLGVSPSALHGVMCGYLCAGADNQGEDYVRNLLNRNTGEINRQAVLVLFEIFSISQQQITHSGFDFQMVLPDEDRPLFTRAQAFSEWCEGFVQGLTMVGVHIDHFFEDDAREALQHLSDFAELDYGALEINEEDESALMEVSEYTRMAVLRLHADLAFNAGGTQSSGSTH
jgi:uncharacterized protein YgfB (UPF0149 family)